MLDTGIMAGDIAKPSLLLQLMCACHCLQGHLFSCCGGCGFSCMVVVKYNSSNVNLVMCCAEPARMYVCSIEHCWLATAMHAIVPEWQKAARHVWVARGLQGGGVDSS